ncbi:CKLF-like MARVEL transmembrane domain-containing protein 1 [Perognathus longimembris pacificus]|uniref:CKLF-like MARVEL transmembrane domain-containing protein 1 n=1 Tax=Perognathus longimembris pacificus TaxID=214514 RepID=UPI0020187EFF|nr:CKLF-like MARVEL transmembrane domain-containing protein 1 [Perognathus longimembris pacificus]
MSSKRAPLGHLNRLESPSLWASSAPTEEAAKPSAHSLKQEHEEFGRSLHRKTLQTPEDKAALKRAEHRTKVPEKYSDSCKSFLFSAPGILKISRMVLVVGAVVCFIASQAHQAFIAITVQEACIVVFFILIYLVTLQHLLICLNWPLLDVMNSLISTVFLFVVAMLMIQEKGRRHLYYVGGTLCLVAAILCCFDGIVVIRSMREMKMAR